MINPVKSGLYLAMLNGYWEVLRFRIYDEHSESEHHEWQYPNNPINIATKYDSYPTEWMELPEVTDRWSKDAPLDGQLCVVHLMGSKSEDHGLAIMKYSAKDMAFVFYYPYDGWSKDYEDWQIDGWGLIVTK
jgi:hypothetical protein